MRIWCPNCHRALWLEVPAEDKWRAHECEHCDCTFWFDICGQIKREL